MYSEFLSTLTGILPISDQVFTQFSLRLKILKIQKGQLLLSEGEVCDRLWFIKTGLVRGYELTDDGSGNFIEATEWFAKEQDFVYSADSFVNQVAARECIEALESCTLIYITRCDLYQLYAEHPEICCFGRIIAERSWLGHKELLRDMRLLSASQKLEAFRQRSKDLVSRVPQKYIASYLGISENYVSKLRAKR